MLNKYGEFKTKLHFGNPDFKVSSFEFKKKRKIMLRTQNRKYDYLNTIRLYIIIDTEEYLKKKTINGSRLMKKNH